MRVRIEAANASTYPDVLAVCGTRDYHDDRRDVLRNPSLIVEILSPSTEAYDRGEKFAVYRRLPSLRQYLLVSQDRVAVELYTRQRDERWLLDAYTTRDAVAAIESIACTLPLGEIYDKVDLA